MSSELDAYKQNRINELKTTFNANVLRLYNSLAITIRSIQNSRNSTQSKQQQINSQVNIYYANVATLQRALNIAITNMQALIMPKAVVISNTANKKALLIGINYTGTRNELYGCINDVNSIKERISNAGF